MKSIVAAWARPWACKGAAIGNCPANQTDSILAFCQAMREATP